MTDITFQPRRRMLIVVSAPSGGGKSTIVKALLEADPELTYSISTTTRPPRASEIDGRHYFFVSRGDFRRMIDEGRFVEWAEVHGNLYGTRIDVIESLLAGDHDVMLDIDVQGAMQLRRRMPNTVLVFLVPPTVHTLEDRLRSRAQDGEEIIQRRLRNAVRELRQANRFDYIVLNESLPDAVAAVQAIIGAERCRTTRRPLLTEPFETAPDEIGGGSTEFAPAIVHGSTVMADLLRAAQRVARTDSPVLLLGESGTGKEVLAEAIHRASARAAKPMVPVNCGAIPPTLLESELFGHVAGAFTGALRDSPGLFRAADGGTLFLDEIGDLPLDLQVKLLRVLQDGELRPVGASESVRVDVRLIAATNRDLALAVAEGRFREDLFYRINVVPLRLPPLRERCDDIPMLVNHCLERVAASGLPLKSVSPQAMKLLLEYDWPGNVRQLENAIEHAVVLSAGDVIAPNDLPEALRRPPPAVEQASKPERRVEKLYDLEVQTIQKALEQSGYNLTRAARMLGITRRALSYRLDKHEIQVERRRGRPRRVE